MSAFDIQIVAKAEATLDQETGKFHPYIRFDLYGNWQDNVVGVSGITHPDTFDTYGEAKEFAKEHLQVTLNATL